jgi:hypothetical protein
MKTNENLFKCIDTNQLSWCFTEQYLMDKLIECCNSINKVKSQIDLALIRYTAKPTYNSLASLFANVNKKCAFILGKAMQTAEDTENAKKGETPICFNSLCLAYNSICSIMNEIYHILTALCENYKKRYTYLIEAHVNALPVCPLGYVLPINKLCRFC